MVNTQKKIKTGAFALFDTFARHGITHIFGYPGGAILPIYDELFFWEKNNLIKHILVRHEQGASHAADAYSRVTQKIGVCFATSGPGATNLVTGIATAQMDSIPMLIITGQVGRSFIGTDAFQETDIFGITLPIVKHSYIIRNADDVSKVVTEALYLAQTGRPGPVLIDIPKDVGLEEVKQYTSFFKKKNVPYQNYIQEYSTTNTILNSALKLFKTSSQPLLYIGGGTINTKKCPKIIKHLIKKFSIPATNTLMGKGIIDDTNNLTVGMLGMHGTAYANFAVSECDLLIALGARFDDRVTGKLDEFASLAKVIHVDIDPAEIGKNRYPQLPIIGDIKKVLHQLVKNEYNQDYVKPEQFEYWVDRINRWKKIYPLNLPKTKNLLPQQIIYQISQLFLNQYIQLMWDNTKCGQLNL